ncbi:phospholipase D family protein [Micromonospora sp. WMMD998]|uniref:phospholipase D family protein n=1 Tax=Micromonospora sp. WMMD998 TaxID=3016092 RepID=UPI00249CB7B5|nr:phospholipase D family protein [Micromonospora sp. WMMD998]WFE41503.1 phospholipase D family protein [Micromonospora sp. WMMD998]
MATVELFLQGGNAGDDTLLDQLLERCKSADGGGGIFAWTNTAGVKAFLRAESFVDFIERSHFQLVVGLDSITDEAAVNALILEVEQKPNLSVWAFLNSDSALFHPKLAWFESGASLTLLVGSGNLTRGGLEKNWEAYVVAQMEGRGAREVSRDIRAWIDRWSNYLVPIDDRRVLDRARRNSGSERSLRRAVSVAEQMATEPGNPILVAEIPRQNGRPGQGNFDRENFEVFFGAQVGLPHQIVLYQVNSDGVLGEMESRQSVEVRSGNYRFELAALREISHREGSWPIGVFMRIRTGEFLYTLLTAEDYGYVTMKSFLQDHCPVRGRQRRRYRTTVDVIRAVWPEAPLWRAQIPAL